MLSLKTLADDILALAESLLGEDLTEAQRGDVHLIASAAHKLHGLINMAVDPGDSLQIRRFVHDTLTQTNIIGGFAGIALRDSVMTDDQQQRVNQIIDKARKLQEVLTALPRR